MDLNKTHEDSQSLFAELSKGLILSGITFVTIVGNSLSLLALFVTKKWHTRYLIVSLACTDLLLGLLVMPFSTISAVKIRWIFGETWCQVQGSLGFFLCQVSVITIMTISVERYILFAYPSIHFKSFQVGSKRMEWLVATTWLYGGLWTFIAWQASRFSYAKELLNCAVDWRYNCILTITFGISTICLPVTVILFCNFKVTLRVSKMLKRFNMNRERLESDSMKRNIAEAKISRMLLILVAAFLLCWAPYSVGGICYLLPKCNWPEEYFIVSVFLCLLNSAVNPILYGTFDRRFRKALKFIVGKLMRLAGRNSTLTQMTAMHMSPTPQNKQENGKLDVVMDRTCL